MTNSDGGDRKESGDAGGDRPDGPAAPSQPGTLAARAPASFWSHVRHYVGGCVAGRVDSASPPPEKNDAAACGPDAESWDIGGGDAGSKQLSALRGLSIRRRWRRGNADGGLTPLVAPPPSPTLTTAIRRRGYVVTQLTYSRRVHGWHIKLAQYIVPLSLSLLDLAALLHIFEAAFSSPLWFDSMLFCGVPFWGLEFLLEGRYHHEDIA